MRILKILTNILGDTRKKTLYEAKLYQSAYFDEATKLPNRFLFKSRLEKLISDLENSEKLALLNIEIDNLRVINDTFGHETGEQIMVKAADILNNLLNEYCELSRFGEEKFTIAIPFRENIKQIEEYARNIIDSFSDPIFTEAGVEALFAVPNIGIAVYPEDGKDADTLMKNADLAVYEAKDDLDRGIVFCTEQLKNRVEENTLLTNRIFRALENNEFSLELQPQISCITGKTVGVEALLRWTIDGSRRIPPDKFIPILEQTGLIHDVGFWVLDQALQEHKTLVAKGFPPLRVSVNLSVV